jgi:hypothetical protein
MISCEGLEHSHRLVRIATSKPYCTKESSDAFGKELFDHDLRMETECPKGSAIYGLTVIDYLIDTE